MSTAQDRVPEGGCLESQRARGTYVTGSLAPMAGHYGLASTHDEPAM